MHRAYTQKGSKEEAAKSAAHCADELRKLAELTDWIVYGLRPAFLTCAEGLGLPPYVLKSLVNHEQPNGGVAGGDLKLTPERLREAAQQVEDKLLKLAEARPRKRIAKRGRALETGMVD
jgi:hypothetical protein